MVTPLPHVQVATLPWTFPSSAVPTEHSVGYGLRVNGLFGCTPVSGALHTGSGICATIGLQLVSHPPFPHDS